MARQSTGPTLEALQAELAHEDYKVRKEAIRKLMRYQRQDALEPLLECLKDERSGVRVKAVVALGQLGDSRAVVPLLGLLNDKTVNVRAKVAEVLGRLGDHSVVLPLHTLLHDPKPQIRQAAVRALGQLRDPASVPLLLVSLRSAAEADEDEEVYYLVNALGNFDTPFVIEPLLALCEMDSHWQGLASEGLSRLGEISTSTLTGIIADGTRSSAVRECVVLALGKKSRPGTAQLLIQALNDSSMLVRQYAAWALGMSGDPIAIEPLLPLLSSESDGLCQAALTALSLLNAQGIEAELLSCLSSKNPSIVYTAAPMLARLRATCPASTLLDVLFKIELVFGWNAVSTLCSLAGPEIVDELIQRLPTIPRAERWRALFIFMRFPDQRAVEPLLALLNEHIPHEHEYYAQLQIVQLLEKLGDARAIAPLRKLHNQTSGSLHFIIREAVKMLESAASLRT